MAKKKRKMPSENERRDRVEKEYEKMTRKQKKRYFSGTRTREIYKEGKGKAGV